MKRKDFASIYHILRPFSTELKYIFFSINFCLEAVQWNLDLRKPDLRKNLDLRKIVGTTNSLVHKLLDLRKIF